MPDEDQVEISAASHQRYRKTAAATNTGQSWRKLTAPSCWSTK